MSRSRLFLMLVLAFALLFTSLFPELVDLVQPPAYAQGSYVYADGYYDAAGGAYIFGGARSDMESAYPQVRDGGFSAMRVAVAHKTLSDPNPDYAFVEIGWWLPSGSSVRRVYASWRTISGVDGFYEHTGLTSSVAALDYRIAVKNNNPSQWSAIWEGAVIRTISPGYTRGAEVGCGGEASSSQNAIGVSACWNVKYKNNNLTSWVVLPSHLSRVSPGYVKYAFSSNSWQSYGNN